jgi:RNA polymerase sigma-70 factor (ECF subfamily)
VEIPSLNSGDEGNGTSVNRAAYDSLGSERAQYYQELLAELRPRLRSLATELLRGNLASRLDPSDLVQETLVKAAEQIGQFQGTSNGEFAAWVNQILRRYMVDTVRHHTSGKRDIRLEVALADCFTEQFPSPSSIFRQKEDLERVATAVNTLRDDQRLAINLRSQGLPFEEIGRQLNRSSDAARMLWGRTILQLGKLLKANESAADRS